VRTAGPWDGPDNRPAGLGDRRGGGPGWQRTDGVTRFDWDFVRPAGQRTDPRAVLLPRTCADCGGPYRSDLDDACPYCHAARPDTEAGWCLDGMYLVVGT